MSVWKLDEALKIIRNLQPETRKFGYHLCLGGGVLNKGESNKDLDLVFVPLDNGKPSNPDGLLEYLGVLWGTWYTFSMPDEHITGIQPVGPQPPDIEPYEPSETTSVYKYKVKFFFDGSDRIDVFIMTPGLEVEQAEYWYKPENAPTGISLDIETQPSTTSAPPTYPGHTYTTPAPRSTVQTASNPYGTWLRNYCIDEQSSVPPVQSAYASGLREAADRLYYEQISQRLAEQAVRSYGVTERPLPAAPIQEANALTPEGLRRQLAYGLSPANNSRLDGIMGQPLGYSPVQAPPSAPVSEPDTEYFYEDLFDDEFDDDSN